MTRLANWPSALTGVAVSLLTLSLSSCGSSGGGGGGGGATTVGAAPAPLSGTWTGTLDYDDGITWRNPGGGGLPTGTHPAQLVLHAVQALPAAPVTVIYTIVYTVVDGVVSGTYEDDAGRTGVIGGTWNGETSVFDVAVTPDDGQDFSLALTGTVEIDEVDPVGSFSGTFTLDSDTTDLDPALAGTSTGAKRFFGQDSADFTSHPLSAIAAGSASWRFEEGISGSPSAELFSLATSEVTLSWDPDDAGPEAAYDVMAIRQTGADLASGVPETWYIAKGHDGAIYRIVHPDGATTADFAGETFALAGTQRMLPAVLTVGATFDAGVAAPGSSWQVESLNAISSGGIAGCIRVSSATETLAVKEGLGPVQWVDSVADEQVFRVTTSTLAADLSGFEPVVTGTWLIEIDPDGVGATPYGLSVLETASLSAETITWNGTADVATRRHDATQAAAIVQSNWFTRDTSGAIYLLKDGEDEGGGMVENEYVPPTLLLPVTPVASQSWVDTDGQVFTVTGLGATSPGGISGCVSVQVVPADGSEIGTLWWKDRQLVAYRWVDEADTVREQGYPGTADEPTFDGTSADFTPVALGTWNNEIDTDGSAGAAFSWEPNAVRPTEDYASSVETVTWQAQSVATRKVEISDMGGVFETIWMARSLSGGIYILQVDEGNGIQAFDPPALLLIGEPELDATWVANGADFTVESLHAISPSGVSGCVMVSEVADGDISINWWKDGTLVAWLRTNDLNNEAERGYVADQPIFASGSDAIEPMAIGDWANEDAPDGATWQADASVPVETVSASNAVILWSGQNVATRKVEIRDGAAALIEELWFAQTPDGDIALLQVDEGQGPMSLYPLGILLPASPAVGMAWSANGATFSVTSVTGTSPGGVTDCVVVTEESYGDISTAWWKNGEQVAWDRGNVSVVFAERGYVVP